jgi:hypothetical protein
MADEVLFPKPQFYIEGEAAELIEPLQQRLENEPERYLAFVSFVGNLVARQEIDDSDTIDIVPEDVEGRHVVDTLLEHSRDLEFDDATEERISHDPNIQKLIKEFQTSKEDDQAERRLNLYRGRLEFFLRGLISWQELHQTSNADIVIFPDDDETPLRSVG